jgi:hypothetical protein
MVHFKFGTAIVGRDLLFKRGNSNFSPGLFISTGLQQFWTGIGRSK